MRRGSATIYAAVAACNLFRGTAYVILDVAVSGLIVWNRAQPLGSRIVCVLLALSLNVFAVATIVLRVEYVMESEQRHVSSRFYVNVIFSIHNTFSFDPKEPDLSRCGRTGASPRSRGLIGMIVRVWL